MALRTLTRRELTSRFDKISFFPPYGATVLMSFEPSQAQKCAMALVHLHNSKVVRIDDQDHSTILAVASHDIAGLRGKPEFRILIFPASGLFMLVDIFEDGVTEMRMEGMQKMHGLLTSRQKKQQDFADSIVGEILTPEFVQEIESFGLEIYGELAIFDGLPQIDIKMKAGSKIIGEITLDGWTGIVLVDYVSIQKAYGGPKEIQDFCWQILENYAPAASATG